MEKQCRKSLSRGWMCTVGFSVLFCVSLMALLSTAGAMEVLAAEGGGPCLNAVRAAFVLPAAQENPWGNDGFGVSSTPESGGILGLVCMLFSLLIFLPRVGVSCSWVKHEK